MTAMFGSFGSLMPTCTVTSVGVAALLEPDCALGAELPVPPVLDTPSLVVPHAASAATRATTKTAVRTLLIEPPVCRYEPDDSDRWRTRVVVMRPRSPRIDVHDALEVATSAGLEVGALRVGDGDEGPLHEVLGDAEQL